MDLGALYPFEGHYLTVPGGRLHYVDEGGGDPVVMVHGNPTWSFHFRELILALRQTHRCVAPDHMGCGRSDRPTDREYPYRLERRIQDLEALLAHLDLQQGVTLVLHDWGGMIGLGWALAHPGAVRRLVLLNTAGFLLPEGKRLPWRLRFARTTGPLAALAVRGANGFLRLALRMATTRGLPPAVAAGYLAPYDSWGNRIALLRFVQDIPLAEGDPGHRICQQVTTSLSRYRDLPVLIGWGGRDFVFDHDFLAEWRRHLPAAEIHEYPAAGHWVLEDAREQLIPVIQEFLARP